LADVTRLPDKDLPRGGVLDGEAEGIARFWLIGVGPTHLVENRGARLVDQRRLRSRPASDNRATS
jgi:hypothetical protein